MPEAASPLVVDKNPALAQLAHGQEGVVSRAQLRELRFSRFQVRNQVAARRWQRVGPRVVVLHTGPLTKRQRWWVGVLHGGPRSALTGLTALEADGLQGFEGDVVHVAVPAEEHVPALQGYRLHWSCRIDDDVHPVRRPPRVRRPSAVLTAAASAPHDLRACAILAAAVQQGLVRVVDLRRALRSRQNLRRRRLLLQVCDDLAGGAHSVAEIDVVRLCRRYRLPAPHCQVRLDRQGRRRYLDLHWDEFGVAAEIDGGQHREVRAWWADMERQNEIVLTTGNIVLRFPAVAVRLFPAQVADQLRRALVAGGWAG